MVREYLREIDSGQRSLTKKLNETVQQSEKLIRTFAQLTKVLQSVSKSQRWLVGEAREAWKNGTDLHKTQREPRLQEIANTTAWIEKVFPRTGAANLWRKVENATELLKFFDTDGDRFQPDHKKQLEEWRSKLNGTGCPPDPDRCIDRRHKRSSEPPVARCSHEPGGIRRLRHRSRFPPVFGSGFPIIGTGVAVIRRSFPVIDRSFPVISRGFSVIDRSFPVIGHSSPVIGRSFPVIGRHFSVIDRSFPVIGRRFSVIGCSSPVEHAGKTL
jgi:hypothetical protein